MSPKFILATLGIIAAAASIFAVGLPLLAGGCVFIGIAHFIP